MKDWRVDIAKYPRRHDISAAAAKMVVGDSLVAAELFADDYQDDFKDSTDRQPCLACDARTLYFCYLTGIECRVWIRWLDQAGR